MNYFIQRTDTSLRYTTVMLISPINAVPGWVALAQDRRAWADVVRQFCDITKVPTPKDERLMEQQGGPTPYISEKRTRSSRAAPTPPPPATQPGRLHSSPSSTASPESATDEAERPSA